MNTAHICFVVMPFGRKPIPDSGGKLYDFEKVYRVIIKRAIEQAGLTPLRADERLGSHLIHAEMFADLRDHPIVLADLSLLNPNVFYELGIRHVMCPAGTILMCREGTPLPFDVKLSRVIHYRFDGESLDWEAVEEAVQSVKEGLIHAKRRQPDSPVHAFLQRVLSSVENSTPEQAGESNPRLARLDALDKFQRELALAWKRDGATCDEKIRKHANSPFGLRAAAHLALEHPTRGGPAIDELPHDLYYLEQFDLANELFAQKKKRRKGFRLRDHLRYASSLSEADASPAGIRRAWKELQAGLAILDAKASPEKGTFGQAKDAAGAHYSAGVFLAWKWHGVTHSPADLKLAIHHLTEAQRWGEAPIAVKFTKGRNPYPVGEMAHVRIYLLLLLRARDQDQERFDHEGHGDAILRLKPSAGQTPQSISYLRWYQVLVHADAGRGPEAMELASETLAEDKHLTRTAKHGPALAIGGKQYRGLRRFIEDWRDLFRHTDHLSRVSQKLLTSAHAKVG